MAALNWCIFQKNRVVCSSAGSKSLGFSRHSSTNFQPILDCFIPDFKLKYEDSFSGSEVPDIKKPSVGRASEDVGPLAELTCHHLIKVAPGRGQQITHQNNKYGNTTTVGLEALLTG